MKTFKEFLLESTFTDLKTTLDSLGIDSFISEKNGIINVSSFRIAKADQNKGIGTLGMKALIKYADETKQIITLSPSTDFGASSLSRLKVFYKRFGFIDNKGKNKDFRFKDTMYRNPK